MPRITKGQRYNRRMKRNVKRSLVRINRRPQSILQPVHYFKRTVWLPEWYVATANTDTFATLNFRLNQLPNFSEFTSLYDQYKINGVKFELIPRYDTNTQVGSAGIATPAHYSSQNWTAIDYDDTVTPTSMADILQYQNVKRTGSSRIMTRFIKPKFADTIFASGVISGYRPQKGFIDCTYPNVEHYGVKFGFSSNPLALTYGLRMTFYIALKNVR